MLQLFEVILVLPAQTELGQRGLSDGDSFGVVLEEREESLVEQGSIVCLLHQLE